jgi:hypothetical protein
MTRTDSSWEAVTTADPVVDLAGFSSPLYVLVA